MDRDAGGAGAHGLLARLLLGSRHLEHVRSEAKSCVHGDVEPGGLAYSSGLLAVGLPTHGLPELGGRGSVQQGVLGLLVSGRVGSLQDGEETLDHPVPGGRVVTEVPQDTVQTSCVQLGVVNEEEYQETGQTLVIQKMPPTELVIVR